MWARPLPKKNVRYQRDLTRNFAVAMTCFAVVDRFHPTISLYGHARHRLSACTIVGAALSVFGSGKCYERVRDICQEFQKQGVEPTRRGWTWLWEERNAMSEEDLEQQYAQLHAQLYENDQPSRIP